ncbi:hypothetical protein ABK040_003546 [Willaertia magna]
MSGKNNYFKPTLKTELETKGYKDLILFQNNRGHFIYFAKNNKNEQIVLKVTDCEDYFSEDEYQLLSTLTHKNIIKVFNSFEVELEGTRWDESLRSTVQDILWEIREEDNNYENYDSGIVDNNNKSNLSDNFKNLLQENGYTVLEQIGRGNYGTVYKAVSQEREIALKVFIRIDQLLLSQEESKAKSVLMEQFLNGEIKYSSKLIDIVMKMLEKDPKNRFSAKQAMNALQNLKEHNNERKVLGTNV